MKTAVKYAAIASAILAGVALASNMAWGSDDAAEIPVPEGCERLVFADDFSTPGAPDSTRWTFEEGYVRNGEMQYYTSGPNAVCKDGILIIEARNDSVTIDGVVCPVTSASLTTRGLHSWKYGYVEVRARISSSRGTWPAIWMMPESSAYGAWPRSGEIDIMEHVGYEPANVHFAAHTERYNHMRGVQNNFVCPAPEAVGSFHTYALRWTPDSLTWLYDGEEKYTLKKEDKADWTSWPFDNEFHLILNLAIGGGWGGQQGVDLEALPRTFEVDYVRVFQ
ncbi:MAG: glycoside hydrolase family 16 protein [Muribaculaceae bacterium]|nr:glycoside hydrolase family 16 protein [Muribaculaceae bacterium]